MLWLSPDFRYLEDLALKMASGYVVPILDISPKQFYQIFLQQKQIAPTAKLKLSNKYSNIDIDWEKVYTFSSVSIHFNTKIREFQYKNFLNCIIFTNVKLESLVKWNRQTALSVKRQRNPSSIYASSLL